MIHTPAHPIDTDPFNTVAFERFTKCLKFDYGSRRTSGASEERLDSCLILVSLWRKSGDVESGIRLKEVRHVDCSVQSGSQDVSTLLGLGKEARQQLKHLFG